MRILMTGHLGYIGTCAVPLFQDRGHDVVGCDTDLFRGSTFGPAIGPAAEVPNLGLDIRDLRPDHLAGHRQVVGLMDVFDRAARRRWCSRRDLDAGLLPPHPEGFGAGAPVLSSSHQVPPRTEVAVDHGVG